jgi:hypothetical protein
MISKVKSGEPVVFFHPIANDDRPKYKCVEKIIPVICC